MTRTSKLSLLGGLTVIAFVCAFVLAYLGTQDTVTATVLDKERVCSGGEQTSCEYRVYTDTETFVNKDSFLFTKFDSADVQGQLRADQTYELEVVGWRIPFLSMFRNIVEVRSP
jgi:hypothetical protein